MSVYQLKVTILGVKPLVWRRLEVPGEFTLEQLAKVLKTAFGWLGGHLHTFEQGRSYWAPPHEDDDMYEGDGLPPRIDTRKVSLAEVKPQREPFVFTYDMGDNWQHVLEIEEIREGTATRARCLDGARSGPPEDCGGTPGYRTLIQVLKNPKHREHAGMKEWVGPYFAPEEFDLSEVNRELARIRVRLLAKKSNAGKPRRGPARGSASLGGAHAWTFKARFRRHAFGWKSQPAITRIKEAVAEIRKVAKTEPAVAADGAIAFLERISPALEQVDSSSGSIGSAVYHAIAELVPLIASAPADAETRDAWLERLFEAHASDQMPYIESLTHEWGELCASKEVASAWAERLIGITRLALSPDKNTRGHFHGTSACLSALFRAERFDDLIELLRVDTIWPYKEWAVRALAAKGDIAAALQYADSCRSPWANDHEVSSVCEQILLASGRIDEAYARYGVAASQRGTYLATFRAVSKKYPRKPASEILADLVTSTPGDEGKWFAAAKDAGLYEDALALAARTPCDPKTLARAARDYAEKEPAFAVGAGLLSLHWLVQGYGYEITSVDVWQAYRFTLAAAERHRGAADAKDRIRKMVAEETAGGFVQKILRAELGL